MPASRVKPVSRYAREAALYFGQLIRSCRLEKKMAAQELAERAGISRALLSRLEKGDLKASLGAYFEVATILELSLFEADRRELEKRIPVLQEKLSLLPQRIRKTREILNDDF